MKNRFVLILVFFLSVLRIEAQVVERLFALSDVKITSRSIVSIFPEAILIDEPNDFLILPNYYNNESFCFDLQTGNKIEGHQVGGMSGRIYTPLDSIILGFSDSGIFIQKDRKEVFNKSEGIQNGISFILKKSPGYIIYFVNHDGIPGAVDTEGKVYTNTEAVNYLKKYDAVKYEESQNRAQKLGLLGLFNRAEVLVWGNTYYSTVENLKRFWKEKYFYPDFLKAIQYDSQGNGYMDAFEPGNNYSDITIVSPEGKWLIDPIKVQSFSKILDVEEYFSNYSSCMYVGFGGNIYYYIAGEEYTEVFRIRRTWGDPDFYAMAINGYTEDEYGKYVDEVLPTLSKSDLRLLRNTVFALYGVHFKSADLSAHFTKQVWYTDEGKTSGEVTLPAHRQKLVEMIQKLEK